MWVRKSEDGFRNVFTHHHSQDTSGNSLLHCISSVFQDEDASTKKRNESSIKPDNIDAVGHLASSCVI